MQPADSLTTLLVARRDAGLLSDPDTLVILGSGMSGCFRDDEYEVIHSEENAIHGHAGRIAIRRGATPAVLLALGRRHLYEGYDRWEATEIVRAAHAVGVRNLVVTNAAGGLNPGFEVGEIMAIDDCIGSLLGALNIDTGRTSGHATRRPLFDPGLTDAVVDLAASRHIVLRRGVYAGVSGPSYETRAEIRMLRRIGAAAVGMSTIPEVAEAARLGIRTVGFSLITNVAVDIVRAPLDHTDVVAEGARAHGTMRDAVEIALRAVSEPRSTNNIPT